MESVINGINDFVPYILMGMTIIIVLLFIIVVVLFKSIGKLEDRYRRLMRGANGKNIENLLNSKLDQIQDAKQNCEDAIEEIKKLENEIKGCVQKVSIMRYKAFEDVGSDLSFSIALLDGNNDGVVLTGIYARQDSTTYAKPI